MADGFTHYLKSRTAVGDFRAGCWAAEQSAANLELIRRAGGDMELARQMHRAANGVVDIKPSLDETPDELLEKYPTALERMARHSAPHVRIARIENAKNEGADRGK